MLKHITLLTLTILLVVFSRFGALDPHTWVLEVLPIFIGIPILIYSYNKFRLSNLLYLLLFIHAIILIIGAHYTYAQVPIGNWLKDTFDLSRNHYDRFGHFAQGFIPAILAREIISRKFILPKNWLFFFVLSICVAFSACFEMFEWFVAVLEGSKADNFLGTQGDIWDTQWDMFMALIGSSLAQLILAKIHDKSIQNIN